VKPQFSYLMLCRRPHRTKWFWHSDLLWRYSTSNATC